MQRISDMLGQSLDCYHIESVLGHGGMGVVYKAVDTSLDKVVALKVMNPMLVEDERFMRRFKAEARALGRLHHPNIVAVFALREIDAHVFIVMEYVEGMTLADRIKHAGAIPWADALPVMEQTLDALAYAHGKGIIHRDVKPHNILLSREGEIKVTDFGLAKVQSAATDSHVATRTGFTGGTLYYMPPEQLEGLARVDRRGDIYGLGMTFYQMLAGRTPFDKLSSEFAILKAIDAHDIAPLGEIADDVPAPLAEIVMRAIERDPDDRFQTTGAMLEALTQWRDTAGDGATTATPELASRSLVAALKNPFATALGAGHSEPETDDEIPETMLSPAPAKRPEKKASRRKKRASDPPQPAPSLPPRAAPKPLLLVRQHPLWAVGAVTVLLLLGGFWMWQGSQPAAPPAPEDSLPTEAALATVSIETEPGEALIFIDDERLGATPLIDHALPAGTYQVRVEKEGYLPLDTLITVDSTAAPPFLFALLEDTPAPETPTTGALTIRSEPAGAEVWLGEARAGTTPLTLVDLDPGARTVTLRLDGFDEFSRAVTIRAGAMEVVRATLTAASVTGTLQIAVRPFGDIYIDGSLKAQNTDAAYTEEVAAGQYRVRAMHPRYGTWVKTITIDRSGPRDVLFDFEQQFSIAVTSEPDEAEILIDGQPTGLLTPSVVRVHPGRRTIAVRRKAYVMEGAAAVLTLEADRTDRPFHFVMREVQ